LVSIKVERFSAGKELRFYSSEKEIPPRGWAVVAPSGLHQAIAASAQSQDGAHTRLSWAEEEAEGCFREPCEVFKDGHFIGDAKVVEVATVNHQPYIELIYTPIPADG
jgi:hypothetical protein